jgi:hypothetical protein
MRHVADAWLMGDTAPARHRRSLKVNDFVCFLIPRGLPVSDRRVETSGKSESRGLFQAAPNAG